MVDLPFQTLVDAFRRLEATRSGNEMAEILADLFRETPIDVIHLVAYFTQGHIVAEYEDVNLNIGEKLMAEAIARASGRERGDIETRYTERGDYGSVAEDELSGPPSDAAGELTVRQVHDEFLAIAEASGTGSQDEKLNRLAQMLNRATAETAKYVVRIALGTLRLGVGTMTILNGLALAFTGTKEKKPLERAYNLCSDLGRVARTIAEGGLDALEAIDIEVGHPIKMMAAQRVELLTDLFEKLPEGFAVEVKYDGERVQAHKSGEDVTLYSRNLEDITPQYPDVARFIREAIDADEAIIEGEVVALVPGTTDQFQEFQILMSRKRKYDIDQYVEEVPVKLMLFDILYMNGESVIDRPFPERRSLLERITQTHERIEPAQLIESNDVEEIETFFNEAVERGFEGIMAKSRAEDSVYRAGAREWSWIKWKRDYSKDLVDSFDVVAVGGFAGRGKRSGTWGALLCAVYNPDLDRYETLCKVSTGFSDEELAELPDVFAALERDEPPARVVSELRPTRWFEPEIVLEIQGAELTRSPVHTCGADDESGEGGIALRFPRFIRFRDDKGPSEATTVAEVQQIYQKT